MRVHFMWARFFDEDCKGSAARIAPPPIVDIARIKKALLPALDRKAYTPLYPSFLQGV